MALATGYHEAVIQDTAYEVSAPSDLISFLKAIPDDRIRRDVRYPQWFLLLVAVLGIHCFAEG